MAAKKSGKKTNQFEFKGYANIAIPESMTSQVEKYLKDVKLSFEEFNTLAVDGYTLKVYFNEDEKNFRASLTCMNAEDDNYGYVLSSFAEDWLTAVQVLCFKHFYVARENWSEYTARSTGNFG